MLFFWEVLGMFAGSVQGGYRATRICGGFRGVSNKFFKGIQKDCKKV